MTKLKELAISRRLWGSVLNAAALGWAFREGYIPPDVFVDGVKGVISLYVGSVAAEHFAAGLAALRQGSKKGLTDAAPLQ